MEIAQAATVCASDDVHPMLVADASQVGLARRMTARFGESLGLGENVRARIAIVVTELANNIIRHASGGEMLMRRLSGCEGEGMEVVALDSGPGMADVSRCLADGFSTGGTPGTGLGAVRRLADEFDIYSEPGQGTAVLVRFYAARPATTTPGVGAVHQALAGEPVSGDAWAVAHEGDRTAVFIVDGLGHGVIASTPALAARAVFESAPFSSPQRLVESMHGALRGTRGAAAAVALLDSARGILRYAGVGNISGSIFSDGRSRGLVSHNGTLGVQARRFQEFEYPWAADSLLIMHSDGLGTRWDLSSYRGLPKRHPGLISGVLYRDFQRKRDDVTVVVVGETWNRSRN